jgi:hypothetical protein
MRRLLLAALLVGLGGCSAILGISDVVAANPDGPLSCAIATSYGLLQGADGDPGAAVEVDADGSILGALALNLDVKTDILAVWLRPGRGAFPGALTEGTFPITGADADFASCGACVFIAADFDSKTGKASDFYMATGGTVKVNSVHGHLDVSVTGLSFTHINLDNDQQLDACTSTVQGVTMRFGLGGQPDAGVPDGKPATPDGRVQVPDAATGGPDAAPVVTPDAAPEADAGVIQGTTINTYINPADAGTTNVAVDLVGSAVEALVPQGGGLNAISGTGRADGSFTITGVPSGPHYVRIGQSYLWTGAPMVDFGDTILGRSDYRVVDNNVAEFAIDIKSGETAADGDFYEFYVPNLNAFFTQSADVGQTELSGTFYFNRAIEALKGDRLTITELATRTSSLGQSYHALSRAVTLSPFSTIDNQTVTVPNTVFTVVPQSGSATVDWLRTQFQGARADVSPAALFSEDALYLFAMPGGNKADLYSSNAPDMFASRRSDTVDVNFGLVHFGNPFPTTWPLYSYQVTVFTVQYLAPGATDPVTMNAYLTRIDPLGGLAQPLGMNLSPPTAPMIAGRDAFTAQSAVGATPVLSWSAPRTGKPDGYIVYLYEITNDSGTTDDTYVATLYGTATALTIPPGLLAIGHTYFAYVTAYIAPNAKPVVGPYRRGFPNAYADLLTATFTP